MRNWLNDSPGFPVSQNADFQNREAANPHGYAVSPVSRFSRFENQGAAQQQDKTANAREEKPAPISEHLSARLKAVAARIDPPFPTHIAESLTAFRYVREAEARRGAVLGVGIGKTSAPEIVTRYQATATDRKARPP